MPQATTLTSTHQPPPQPPPLQPAAASTTAGLPTPRPPTTCVHSKTEGVVLGEMDSITAVPSIVVGTEDADEAGGHNSSAKSSISSQGTGNEEENERQSEWRPEIPFGNVSWRGDEEAREKFGIFNIRFQRNGNCGNQEKQKSVQKRSKTIRNKKTHQKMLSKSNSIKIRRTVQRPPVVIEC